MRKYVAFFLIFALLAGVLAGCTPEDANDPQTPDETPDEVPDKTPDETPDEPKPVEATHVTFTVGSVGESRYMYENQGGNIDASGNRYADLERYFIYRFPVNGEHKTATLGLTIANQYKISASVDGKNYDVVASTTEKSVTNMTLDLTSYLPESGDGYIYVRIGDAHPADGWGGNVRANNPVLFFSGSEEEAKVVVAEYQSGLQLTQTSLSAMFDSYVAELSDGSKLPYRLYVPENYDPKQVYPLLVVLHGAGERGNDNESQLRNMLLAMFNVKDTPVRDAIILAPQCPAGQQWVDTPWAKGNYDSTKVKESNELAGVVELVDDLWYEYSIDGDRIYAMGLSMGGFGTWDLLIRHSDIFAAGVPICGGGDPAMAEVLANVPIKTFHGSADPTVPVAGTRAMAEALEAAGSEVFTYEELAGKEHGIWNDVAGRIDVLNWLFEQNLKNR